MRQGFPRFQSRIISSKGTYGIILWTISIYLFTLINDFLNWPILQFARVVSPIKYRDTSWVLEDADCYREIGSKIYSLPSETGCPGYLYGRPLLEVLNFMHISQNDTLAFVYTLRALFALSFAFLIAKLSANLFAKFTLTGLILFSPGVQLMVYNSNIDLLIFAMVVFGTFAIQRGYITLGLFLVFLSGLFKFYTIPLLLLFILLLTKKRHKVLSLLVFLVATVSAALDLLLMQEPIPAGGYAQFGVTIFSKYLEQVGISLSAASTFIFSGLIFLATVLLVLSIFHSFKAEVKFREISEQPLFLVFASVFISCFLTGISYDTRLIYLTFAGYYFLLILPQGLARKAFMTFLAIASLLSCGIELGFISESDSGFHPLRGVQLVNDIAIEFLAAIFFVTLVFWFFKRVQRVHA
jgi:hypothetical protein